MITVAALVGGGLLAAPAMATSPAIPPATAAKRVAPDPGYTINITSAGGLIAFNGAEARVQGMSLNVVDSTTGAVLDSLPEIYTTEEGLRLRFLYDISNPSQVTFTLMPITKNRFNWGACAIAGAGTLIPIGDFSKQLGKVAIKTAISTVLKATGPAGWILNGLWAAGACAAAGFIG